MRTTRLKSSILAGISALMLLANGKGGSLKDITKPYTGIYKCTEARFAEQDYLNRFEEIAIELKSNGDFLLYYREKGCASKTEKGRYVYDKENKTITFEAGANGFFKRAFPLENGVLTMDIRFAEKNLILQFERD